MWQGVLSPSRVTAATLDGEEHRGVGSEVMLKRSFVFWAVALLVAIIPSCGGDDDAPPPKLAEPCHANSDCGGDLVCALGKCHSPCANTKDCPMGQRCVKTDTSTACQLPAESKCTFNSDCTYPLICAIDRACRNQCQA